MRVAVAKTYSKGDNVLGKSSGAMEGMISRFVRPRCERIWRRRGDEEARITRFVRRSVRTGRDRGGGRGRGVLVVVVVVAVVAAAVGGMEEMEEAT